MIKLATAAVLAAAAPSFAVLTFSDDEAAFVAGLSNPVTEDFGFVPAGAADVSFPIADGRQAAGSIFLTPFGTESGLGELEIRPASSVEPSSEADLFAFLDSSPDAFGFTIDFGAPVTSFGGNFFSASSFGGSTITLDNGDSFDVASSLIGPDGSGFLGFTSDTSFTDITFTVTGDTDFEGLFIQDVVADLVPEPATLSFLAVGTLALVRRRR